MSKTPATLGLYIWLVGNQDKYKFAFSPQAIENQLGMARNSCHGAVKRLEELGYLVPRENSNVYDFYECSQTIKTMDRGRLVEAEMHNFENMPSPTEDDAPFPRAKQGNFSF
jgi:biotin operon repressor